MYGGKKLNCFQSNRKMKHHKEEPGDRNQDGRFAKGNQISIGTKHAYKGGNTKYANDRGYNLWMDPFLKVQLDNVRKAVRRDDDFVGIVDGMERAGKSVFGMHLAHYLSGGNLKLKNVVFDAEDFIYRVRGADKYDAIVFDEAFRGGSWRQAMSKISNALTQVMMEMGQKNLFIIIIIPDALELSSYIKFHRSKVLFHVYKYKGHRGFWKAWAGAKKKELLHKAKTKRTYMVGVRMTCGGRFPNHYCVNEENYREKKSKAFLGGATISNVNKDPGEKKVKKSDSNSPQESILFED